VTMYSASGPGSNPELPKYEALVLGSQSRRSLWYQHHAAMKDTELPTIITEVYLQLQPLHYCALVFILPVSLSKNPRSLVRT
jgi:hypothetical protein